MEIRRLNLHVEAAKYTYVHKKIKEWFHFAGAYHFNIPFILYVFSL